MRNILVLLLVVALAAGLLWLACSKEPSSVLAPTDESQQVAKPVGVPLGIERAMAVQEEHTARLLALADVVGTATGLGPDGTPVVMVLTERPGVPGIPPGLDGVPVVVEVTGAIRALKRPSPEKIDPTSRFPRPVPIGVSTGNEGECSSGTIGCRVTKGKDVYALSNNHVYALENKGRTGSDILQPGRYDTNCAVDPQNVIGTLADFAEIVFSTSASNRIDAAIALSSEDKLGKATPSNGYGTPASAVQLAALGLKVQKYGRTTALTKGQVTMVNATVLVGYGSGTAQFVDQVIVEARRAFVKAGDSGSLVVTDPECKPVGLLFAGNPSGNLAVANRIELVLDRFGVNVDGK
jgi:hypothetical protein